MTAFEEIMLQGLVIGYIKAELSEILIQVEQFLPKIDNWAVCDRFLCGTEAAETISAGDVGIYCAVSERCKTVLYSVWCCHAARLLY